MQIFLASLYDIVLKYIFLCANFEQGSAVLTARVSECVTKEAMIKYIRLLNQYWYDVHWFLTSGDFTLQLYVWFCDMPIYCNFMILCMMYFMYFVGNEE